MGEVIQPPSFAMKDGVVLKKSYQERCYES
jgi:hypothetical protein